jgi:hypothetical protein
MQALRADIAAFESALQRAALAVRSFSRRVKLEEARRGRLPLLRCDAAESETISAPFKLATDPGELLICP